MNKLIIIGDILSIILAFGLQTNGLKRQKIINFSKYGIVIFLLLFAIITFFTQVPWILTASIEILIVFAVSNLVLSILFKKVIKPN